MYRLIMFNKLIQQIILIADNKYNLFDFRNWTFYTKELFPAIKEHSWIICDSLDYFFSSFDKYFINYYNSNFIIMSYSDLINIRLKNKSNFIFHLALAYIENYITQWYYIYYISGTFYSSTIIDITIISFFYFHINIYFNFLFLLLLLIKAHFDFSQVSECTWSNIALFYQFIIYDSLTLVLNKYESSEEALCIVVLWPWCFLLVFTHVFLIDNNEILFIFIEWGLPIVYGFFLLFEHLWNFGSYFFVYLNGGRGTRSMLIVIIEDILTVLLLLFALVYRLCAVYYVVFFIIFLGVFMIAFLIYIMHICIILIGQSLFLC